MTTTKFAAGDPADTPEGRATIIGATTDQDGLPAYRVVLRNGAHATFSDYELTPVVRLGLEIPELYDGVAIWVDEDGTMTNRLASMPGLEERAAKVDRWIAFARNVLEEAGL
jgi:hypothetical protein